MTYFGCVRFVFIMLVGPFFFSFFFFNDTATTEIYTLSLHDALPISDRRSAFPFKIFVEQSALDAWAKLNGRPLTSRDRKSTRLNSSHGYISYAVFCLKKKKKKTRLQQKKM